MSIDDVDPEDVDDGAVVALLELSLDAADPSVEVGPVFVVSAATGSFGLKHAATLMKATANVWLGLMS